VIWYSGLIRGAVAFAMIMQIKSENAKFLVSTIMGIVLLTTLALGALLPSFTRFVRLENSTDART
jgi:ABC-type Mn2+/Zn2+ transport system permease subunit